MNYTLSLAAKNLLRYKRRTILTFLVLSFGVAIYIFYTGMLDGFSKSSFENMINFETGHLKINSLQFSRSTPYTLTNLITEKELIATTKILKTKKFITGSTVRLSFTGEVDNGRDAVPCLVTGIDPKLDSTVFTLTKYIEEGSLTEEGALIGYRLAKNLGLSIKDSLFLTIRRKGGMLDSVAIPITGIIRSADPQVNQSSIYLNLKKAQQLAGVTGVTEIAIRTVDHTKHEQYRKELHSIFPALKITSWWQLAEQMAALSRTKTTVSYVFVLFLGVIAIVGIINTMLISVYEKKHEIGTMKALGMSDRDIKKIFLTEGAIIGCVGSIAGILIGCAVNLYFATYGLDIASIIGDKDINIGFKVMGAVKSRWDILSILLAFFLSVTASILASIYPAKKTVKLQPAETLRTIQ